MYEWTGDISAHETLAMTSLVVHQSPLSYLQLGLPKHHRSPQISWYGRYCLILNFRSI